MNTILRVFVAGTCIFTALSLPSFAVDATYNNLEVNGQADFAGANTTFGTSGTASAGVVLNYIDGSTGTITLIATPSSAAWQWAVTSGTSAVLSMRLDGNNQLSLYTTGTGNSAGVVLNPATSGTSTLAGSITIGGTNNVLPNQVLLSGSSILTRSLADARYAISGSNGSFGSLMIGTGGTLSNGAIMALGNNASALAPDSAAIGNYAYASGTSSIAIGYTAEADGLNAVGIMGTAFGDNSVAVYGYADAYLSTAIGGGDAEGEGSLALGFGSGANGRYSTALGAGSNTYGDYSIAIGNYSETDGLYSIAFGNYTLAHGYAELVTGRYNIAQGSGTSWVTTDDLFVVGNGTSSGSRSNAFVVSKNGDTKVYGALTVSGTTGNANQINGSTTLNGVVTITGTVSSGSGSNLIVTGTNNVLPNQMLVSGSSILTEGLADGRYAQIGQSGSFSGLVIGNGASNTSGIIALGGTSSATGVNSAAIGLNSTASGTYSVALGKNATASGYSSFAGMSGTASGTSSLAIGSNALASGTASVSIGRSSRSTSNGALAIGDGAYASGYESVAVGTGTAAGYKSAVIFGQAYGESGLAMAGGAAQGYSTVSIGLYSMNFGFDSTAIGGETYAGGNYTTSIGYSTYSDGNYSVCFGSNSLAQGDYATAIGAYSYANGDFSIAAGQGVNAGGYEQFVIGQWNLTQGDASNWVATDNLFIVGNGVDGDHPSNAFVVMKNGDTLVNGAFTISGTTGNLNTIANGGLAVTGTTVPVVLDSGTVNTVVATGTNNLLLVPQQGDLSMGEFVEGAKPPSH